MEGKRSDTFGSDATFSFTARRNTDIVFINNHSVDFSLFLFSPLIYFTKMLFLMTQQGSDHFSLQIPPGAASEPDRVAVWRIQRGFWNRAAPLKSGKKIFKKTESAYDVGALRRSSFTPL